MEEEEDNNSLSQELSRLVVVGDWMECAMGCCPTITLFETIWQWHPYKEDVLD
jgi:hypothetical protein